MTRIQSPRLKISYPDPVPNDEPPDVPEDIKKIIDGVEQSAIYGQGTLGNRPVSTGGSPGIIGRIYYATDVGIVYWDMGTGWVAVNEKPEIVFGVGGFGGVVPYKGKTVLYNPQVGGALAPGLWEMIYEPDAIFGGTYPWLFVGGSPIHYEEIAADTETATSYTQIIPGIAWDPDVDGIYEISYGAYIDNSGSTNTTYISLKYAAGVPVDADAIAVEGDKAAAVSRTLVKTLDSSQLISLYARVTAGTGTFSRMWMTIKPVQLNQSTS